MARSRTDILRFGPDRLPTLISQFGGRLFNPRGDRPNVPGRIQDPPDPDGFFKARIEIHKPEIRVYVNDRTEPCLVVKELSDRTGGRVGLWMGNGSDGSFAELVLKPARSP